jgi:hypothetical protein
MFITYDSIMFCITNIMHYIIIEGNPIHILSIYIFHILDLIIYIILTVYNTINHVEFTYMIGQQNTMDYIHEFFNFLILKQFVSQSRTMRSRLLFWQIDQFNIIVHIFKTLDFFFTQIFCHTTSKRHIICLDHMEK